MKHVDKLAYGVIIVLTCVTGYLVAKQVREERKAKREASGGSAAPAAG